jgi:hypothetical protein
MAPSSQELEPPANPGRFKWLPRLAIEPTYIQEFEENLERAINSKEFERVIQMITVGFGSIVGGAAGLMLGDGGATLTGMAIGASASAWAKNRITQELSPIKNSTKNLSLFFQEMKEVNMYAKN